MRRRAFDYAISMLLPRQRYADTFFADTAAAPPF